MPETDVLASINPIGEAMTSDTLARHGLRGVLPYTRAADTVSELLIAAGPYGAGAAQRA